MHAQTLTRQGSKKEKAKKNAMAATMNCSVAGFACHAELCVDAALFALLATCYIKLCAALRSPGNANESTFVFVTTKDRCFCPCKAEATKADAIINHVMVKQHNLRSTTRAAREFQVSSCDVIC